MVAAQTQLNDITQRLADRHQSDLKAMQASKRNARERENENKIDPPTGNLLFSLHYSTHTFNIVCPVQVFFLKLCTCFFRPTLA